MSMIGIMEEMDHISVSAPLTYLKEYGGFHDVGD